MSISGDDVENGASRLGQSVTGLATTGADTISPASAATQIFTRIIIFLL
jgi:hypothetical protein